MYPQNVTASNIFSISNFLHKPQCIDCQKYFFKNVILISSDRITSSAYIAYKHKSKTEFHILKNIKRPDHLGAMIQQTDIAVKLIPTRPSFCVGGFIYFCICKNVENPG